MNSDASGDVQRRRALGEGRTNGCTSFKTCTPLALLLALAGCGSPPDATDGSMPPGDGGESLGRVVVVFAEADVEEALATVDEVLVGVDTLTANNDRGGEFEPRVEHVGSLDLDASPEVVLEPAAPAAYGRVTFKMAQGDWGSTLALAIHDATRRWVVTLASEVLVDARCETVALLPPGGVVRLSLKLEVDGLYEVLAASGVAPGADGVIRIDASTAPEATAAIAGELATAWELDCDAAASAALVGSSE